MVSNTREHRARSVENREAGLCGCGRARDTDKRDCSGCQELDRLRHGDPAVRERMQVRMRAERQRWQREGLCRKCGHARESAARLCDRCKVSKAQTEARRKLRLRGGLA